MNLFVCNFDSSDIVRITSDTLRDIDSYFWSGSNRLVYLQDTDGDENYKLIAVNIDGSGTVNLTPFERTKVYVIDDLPDNDDEMIIAMNRRNPSIFDAYKINVNTGELTLLMQNPGNITSWFTDNKGVLRLATSSNGLTTDLLYRDNASEPFRKIMSYNFRDEFEPAFFTEDNKNIYALSNIGRDKIAAVEFDPVQAKEIKTVYENSEVDVSKLVKSEKNNKLIVAVYSTWKKQFHYFDDKAAGLLKEIENKLPGYESIIAGNDRNEDRFIIRTFSDKSLGAFYSFDSKSKTLKKLSDVSPWLNENNMADMKPISFQARDGMMINGYLTLPKGLDPVDLPTVIYPHGGPWLRDYWGFDRDVQFLANRGYAVLQINYRGSTGYGRKFFEAGFKEWGQKMQNDITDGANWLIKQSIADSTKIGIYGYSYGGYAALAGLTYTPNLYACGVDYAGISNIFTFLNSVPPYWAPFKKMLSEMVGDPVQDSVMLRKYSPFYHVDKIKVPVLIAQGKRDPKVNINETALLVSRLKARGINVEYMVKDNEGHGFKKEENRFEFYRAMEKFFGKYLGGRTSPTSK